MRALLADGYPASNLLPVENRTVVTEPWKGARNNRWLPVLERYGLPFQPLTEVGWKVHRFKSPLLMLDKIFPEGIEIPEIYEGRQILHLPTVKTHGHSTTTGSVDATDPDSQTGEGGSVFIDVKGNVAISEVGQIFATTNQSGKSGSIDFSANSLTIRGVTEALLPE